MTANGLALVCVFDGLRPDMVRPDWTPHLDQLRQRGVWFSRSHCVFPSVTRINASSLVTGSFPCAHDIPGNTLWCPDVVPERRLQTGDAADLRRMQAVQGRMLALPTRGETLAATGVRTVAVGTGSSSAAYLLHPEASHTDGLLYHHDFAEPPELAAQVAAALGAPPSAGDLSALAAARVEYGARALTDVLIPSANPAAALFWITIPDGPYRAYGIGAPESVAAICAADASFGTMLERLAAIGLADDLTLFVTSDHGYITVTDNLDLEAILISAGLKRSADSPELSLCTEGRTCHIYSDGSADLGAVAAFLLAQPWTAAVFSRAPLPGTLPLAAVGYDGTRAPNLIVTLRGTTARTSTV